MRARARSRALMLALALGPAACGTDQPAVDYGDPTSLNTPTERSGITAYVVSPTVQDAISSPALSLSVAAWTADAQALSVTVTLPEGQVLSARAEGDAGPRQRFLADVPLLHGDNPLLIRIATLDQSRIRYLSYNVRYQGADPAVRGAVAVGADAMDPCAAATPVGDAPTRAARVCLRGRATVAEGATLGTVRVEGSGGSMDITPGGDGAFAVPVALAADQLNHFTLTVSDDAGRSASASVDVVQDSTPPALTVEGATEGAVVQTMDANYTLRGTAADDNGLGALRVEFGDGGQLGITAAAMWSAVLRVSDGANAIRVVATDRAGNESHVSFTLRRDREVLLRAPATGAGTTRLDLDRFALGALLPAADQQQIRLVEIPLRPTLLATLRAIRDPFTSGIDTSAWRQPEWNLYRLLNMTPDSANLVGTSLEPMLQLAAAIGLPPPRILAQLLALTTTTPVVDLDRVADVLLDLLVGTHPNATRNASGEVVLRISLYDALQDMAPLAARFGPVGAHPGFLSGMVHGSVFEPGFQMSIPARSNLREYEGIDASAQAKRFVFVQRSGTGVVELDFNSPDFAVVGLVDLPTVDLGFVIREDPAFLRSGTVRLAGADTMDSGFYRGNGAVFSTQPWYIERLVAEAAYRQYHRAFSSTMFTNTLRYNAGSITNAAVIQWDRGWVTVTTSGGVGNPPPPAYSWDLLSETAQVRLHDGGVPEGMANLAFTLRGLSIGLDADQLIASVRPTLMAQSADLARRIVGSSALAVSTADVFYLPPETTGARGYLAFRSAADTPAPYPYMQPGFFDDMALTHRVSMTAQPGSTDTTREKVPAEAGRTYFIRDDGGMVFSLTVISVDAEGVRVRVSQPLGGR